ncbi:HAMP domain-containing histidine kinase [bacterium]|nr:HAMP domain-containing histidine kinase [bacterium]
MKYKKNLTTNIKKLVILTFCIHFVAIVAIALISNTIIIPRILKYFDFSVLKYSLTNVMERYDISDENSSDKFNSEMAVFLRSLKPLENLIIFDENDDVIWEHAACVITHEEMRGIQRQKYYPGKMKLYSKQLIELSNGKKYVSLFSADFRDFVLIYDLTFVIFTFILFIINLGMGIFIYGKFKRITDPVLQEINALDEGAEITEGEVYEDEKDFLCSTIERYKQNNLEYISQLDKKTNQLLIENRRVQTLLKFKDTFTSNITHELKTPLTIMKGYFHQYLKEPEKYREKMEDYFTKNLKRLEELINHILETSKIDNVLDEKLNIKENDLKKLLFKIVDELSPAVADKELQMETEIEEIDQMIPFDEDILSSVYENLITNSMKFSDPGGVITVYLMRKGSSIITGVRDTGRGIPSHKLKKVFDLYYQADINPSSGVGLGLAIVKDIVEKHGWEIQIDSKITRGTDISFIIPLE